MPAEPSANATWGQIAARLREMLNAGIYSTWFGQVQPLEQQDDRLVVGVPNAFTKDWIEGHFGSLLDAAASEQEMVVELRVAVSEAMAARVAEPEPEEDAPADDPDGLDIATRAGINPRYTFDVFVIGASNRFAHAAALAVAEAPAQSYNPLFLAGSTGLGKTHLLQAIAHYVLEEHAGLRVRYVTCEAFTNDFIDALQEKRLEQFKGRYRAYDVLLVDDIQFLAGKQRMQEEFFHTFNTLYESGSQIVLTSDRRS